MKRVLTAVLLCLLVLLCGCMRQPEAEPPAQEAVSVSPVPVQENDPASVEQKTEAQDPVPIPDGIVKSTAWRFTIKTASRLPAPV